VCDDISRIPILQSLEECRYDMLVHVMARNTARRNRPCVHQHLMTPPIRVRVRVRVRPMCSSASHDSSMPSPK